VGGGGGGDCSHIFPPLLRNRAAEHSVNKNLAHSFKGTET
jgi:hypothetical protein